MIMLARHEKVNFIEKVVQKALMERSIRMFDKASYGATVTLELMGNHLKVKKTPEVVAWVRRVKKDAALGELEFTWSE
jgi:hypothetical protein